MLSSTSAVTLATETMLTDVWYDLETFAKGKQNGPIWEDGGLGRDLEDVSQDHGSS